ncbi:IS5 family transposase, partial [Niveibacterium sp. 24ML]|uniref:IS5 family transposase n=1 Tax=Niveibacterium sp. 24ML TaxID=2985512 RepID=UPI00226DF121
TGGEAGDSPQALPLLGALKPNSLSADKAYDTDAILEHLNDHGIEAVIPPRSHRIVQRAFDRHQYKNRNLVERFFCRIKHFRRIATRYDKLAERFAAFVALSASVIWLA